jgi:hypothetical protein
MSQPRERVSLTLPPDLVQRIESERRELSKLAGVQLSPSQAAEAVLERSLKQSREVSK